MPNHNQLEPSALAEKMYTLPQVATILNMPVSTIRRAAKSGLIPIYRPFNQRVRVRLSEVIAAIADAQMGAR